MSSAESDSTSKKLILVVDDDVDYTVAARLILTNGGYDTAIVHSGEECRRYLQDAKPDAILLDMMMETWSEGNNVVTYLRSSPKIKDIPIILASAVDFRSSTDDMSEAEESMDVDGYMTKPIVPEKLLKQLGDVIAAAEKRSA